MRCFAVLFVDVDIWIKRVLLVGISGILGHDVEHLMLAWPSICLSSGLEADRYVRSLVAIRIGTRMVETSETN